MAPNARMMAELPCLVSANGGELGFAKPASHNSFREVSGIHEASQTNTSFTLNSVPLYHHLVHGTGTTWNDLIFFLPSHTYTSVLAAMTFHILHDPCTASGTGFSSFCTWRLAWRTFILGPCGHVHLFVVLQIIEVEESGRFEVSDLPVWFFTLELYFYV